MAVGKRSSADEPLTEHDVAERLRQAMHRVTKILADLGHDPEVAHQVATSRYFYGGTVESMREFLDYFESAARVGARAHAYDWGKTPDTSPEPNGHPVVEGEVAQAVHAERLRIAAEMREEAESLSPGGRGDPNDCGRADLLLAWASGLEKEGT